MSDGPKIPEWVNTVIGIAGLAATIVGYFLFRESKENLTGAFRMFASPVTAPVLLVAASLGVISVAAWVVLIRQRHASDEMLAAIGDWIARARPAFAVVSAAFALVVLVIFMMGAVTKGDWPRSLIEPDFVSAFRQVARSGDDQAVFDMSALTVRHDMFADSPRDAAEVLADQIGATDRLWVRSQSATGAVLGPLISDYPRVTLSNSHGIPTVESILTAASVAKQVETNNQPLVVETPYLPLGTRIAVAPSQSTVLSVTHLLVYQNGKQVDDRVDHEETITAGQNGLVWRGIGRAITGVGDVNIGTGTTDDGAIVGVGRVFGPNTGELWAGLTVYDHSGKMVRLVALAPDGRSYRASKAESQGLQYAGETLAIPFSRPDSPPGNYVIVAVVDGMPGAWETITCTP